MLSPDQFGVPQTRRRVFIVGKLGRLEGFEWPAPLETATSLRSVLDTDREHGTLPPKVERALEIWQQFISRFPKEKQLPSFPIWGMEFGATYRFEDFAPWCQTAAELDRTRGSLGEKLEGLDREEALQRLPSYARTKQERFPRWKVRFIQQNRALYDENRTWIDKWKGQLAELPASFQKLEWNAKGEERDLYKLVLQLRPSGIRAKRASSSPALVAMTNTQVPIVGWERRFLTPRECARLQSLNDPNFAIPNRPIRAYAALGNAVNAEVVRHLAVSLFDGERILATENEQSPQDRVTTKQLVLSARSNQP